MGVGGGIDDDEVDTIPLRLLDAVNQRRLRVALERLEPGTRAAACLVSLAIMASRVSFP